MDTGNHQSLVESASHGDEPSIEALLERHLPGLRAYVRLHASPQIRQRESCSDLVQSVCREVLEELDSFEYRGEAAFRSWLFTKAMGKILNRHRFHVADKRCAERELHTDDLGRGHRLHELFASFCTPSQVAIGREDLERLERAFDALPADYRRVITMARLIGLSHAEIAAEMQRSEGSVRVLLHRAIVRLGWLMMQRGDEAVPDPNRKP